LLSSLVLDGKSSSGKLTVRLCIVCAGIFSIVRTLRGKAIVQHAIPCISCFSCSVRYSSSHSHRRNSCGESLVIQRKMHKWWNPGLVHIRLLLQGTLEGCARVLKADYQTSLTMTKRTARSRGKVREVLSWGFRLGNMLIGRQSHPFWGWFDFYAPEANSMRAKRLP
jgi:2-polyprenyl-6-methoxyphenol hydroxylase-like FAD-dependent oxidoreductase